MNNNRRKYLLKILGKDIIDNLDKKEIYTWQMLPILERLPNDIYESVLLKILEEYSILKWMDRDKIKAILLFNKLGNGKTLKKVISSKYIDFLPYDKKYNNVVRDVVMSNPLLTNYIDMRYWDAFSEDDIIYLIDSGEFMNFFAEKNCYIPECV